jgi:hypothetical protein
MTAQQEFARAHAANRRHAADLISRADVTGVGIGLDRRGGKLTEQRVLKVYVAHKRPLNDLRPGRVLPRTIATDEGEVKIDVEEMPIPKIPPMHLPRGEVAMAEARLRVQRRPAVGGSSVAHHLFPVGTVALGVLDLLTGDPCVLSCNHVLAQLDGAVVGDPVLQPSQADGGALPGSVIGLVRRWTNVRFGGPANLADAAIAACPPGIAVSYVDGVGPITAISPGVELGEKVRKVGRASGETAGRVIAIRGSFKANYAMLGFGNTPALFTDQIVSDLECGYGDSGSLLLDSQNRAAGLLFAATDLRHTWFNPFHHVADALGIGLLPYTE